MSYRRALLALAALALPGPASAACSLAKIAELPVEMSGMQPLVSAKVDGTELKFLADSGAFFSVLSDPTVQKLKLVTHGLPDDFRLVGVDGATDAGITVVKRFTLGASTIPNVDFLVAGQRFGRSVAGVIGQNVLKLADVEYDLGGGVIRLIQAKGCEQNDLAYWAEGKPYSALDIRKGELGWRATVASVMINGTRLDALLDTGAGASLLSLSAASRLGLGPNKPGVTTAGLISGLAGRPVRTWVAPVASFQIGDETIKDTRLRIGDLGDQRVDMLLGADFFRSHRIYVANSQHRLFFTYNGKGPVFDIRAALPAPPPGQPSQPSENGNRSAQNP